MLLPQLQRRLDIVRRPAQEEGSQGRHAREYSGDAVFNVVYAVDNGVSPVIVVLLVEYTPKIDLEPDGGDGGRSVYSSIY